MNGVLGLFQAALSSLVRAPGFSLTVILTLGLGIGASTGIFSVYHHLLLEPLPVHEPQRLVNLASPGPRQGSTSCAIIGPCEEVFSYPLFRDLEREQAVFANLAAHVEIGANVAFDDQTAAVDGLLVSGQYFSTLGLVPAYGRLIGPDDDVVLGQSRVAVLSHDFWQRALNADPTVIGRTIRVNGQDLSVIGIAPSGFAGTTRGREADLFVPLGLRWLLQPGTPHDHEDRVHHFLYLFARLASGLDREQAQAGITPIFRGILNEVEAPLQTRLSEAQRVRFGQREILLRPGGLGQSEVNHVSQVPMTIMLAASLILLMIACANVANLMLARVVNQSGEMAVRTALGAPRGRLVAHLLAESLWLSLLGGLAGVLLSFGFIAIIAYLLETSLISGIEPGIHMGILGFTALLSLVCALGCGAYPAWRASRIPPASSLSDASGRSGAGPRSARMQQALVTGQIGLSVTLLVVAGLFVHSLWNLSRAPSGMVSESVLTFAVSPVRSGYSAEAAMHLFEALEQRLAALPGVEAASAAGVPVLSGFGWQTNVRVADQAGSAGAERNVYYNMVGAGFLETLGIPLRAGRDFDQADRAGSARVALVNEAFVRHLELGNDPIGRYLGFESSPDRAFDIEIVGVVGDTRPRSLRGNFEPQFYIPYAQSGHPGRMHFFLRSSLDPGSLRPAVRAAVAELDAQLPIEDFHTLKEVIRSDLVLDRSIGTLASLVAVMALMLVAVGLYSVLSYLLARRTREIGLRSALGADPGRIGRMVFGQVLSMAAIGVGSGLAAAWLVAGTLDSLLFELGGLDAGTTLSVCALVIAILIIAAWVPARRAASMQPMEALRDQ
ncbi:MAG: ABC transporter permease [Wenzhouxiangella sp.]